MLLSTIIKDTEIKVFSYDYILWSEKKEVRYYECKSQIY